RLFDDPQGFGSGAVRVNPGATLSFAPISAFLNLANPIELGGTLKSESIGGNEVSGLLTLTNNAIIDCGSSINLSGQLTDNGSSPTLTKTGFGTLLLDNNLTVNLSGGVTVALGTLFVATAADLPPAAPTTILDGGAIMFQGGGGDGYTINRPLEIIGAGSTNNPLGAAGALVSASSLTWSGNVTLTGNTTLNSIGTMTITGNISGAGGLNKIGAGALVLSANNNYGGATTINFGTLRTEGGNAIPDGSAVTLSNTNGVLLDLDGTDETIGSLAGGGVTGGNVALGTATLTTGGDNSSTTFAGAINGAGGLMKTGAGIFTLAGNNTYSGLTDVQQGTLRLGTVTCLPNTNAVNVAGGGTLDVNSLDKTLSSITGTGQVTLGTGELTLGAADASGDFSGSISGSGSLVKIGNGTLTLDGANSYSGGTTVVAGRLRGPAGGLQGDIVNQSIVEFDQTTDGTYNGVISGTGSLIKTGPGRLTIATPATFTLATTVAEGTLALHNTPNTPGGAITIESAGTLEANGIVQRAIIGDGTLTATGNLLVGDLTSGSGFDFSGTVNVGNHSVVLLDADLADLGGGTIAGGSLTTLSGLKLSGTFGGDGTVNGPFVNNGAVAGPTTPAALTFAGPVSGAGSFTGNVRILDSFSPGSSPAAVSFEHVSLGGQAMLSIELGGLISGLEHDMLAATGTVLLDGTLQVTFINGFLPAAGNTFDILDWTSLSGTFDTLQLPALGPAQGVDLMWNASQLYTAGVLSVVLAGDYNGDGTVDAADYVVWRKGVGVASTPENYNVWRANFGESIGSGSGAASPFQAAAPEPTSLALLLIASVHCIVPRRTNQPARCSPVPPTRPAPRSSR
ncbi:MAG: autotransporter-associated beta strand repeat-containing protein, partial [Planctomycetes bacterium]|nr:autotransporter-associated beta strand repeat-containing protein [Planctomycetota bacterium]